MKIKLYKIDNLAEFMDLVNGCKGQVYIISPQGDKLNLKSTLVKFVALANLFNSSVIEKLELEVTGKDDEQKIIDFMINGKNSKNVPQKQ